MGNLSSRIGFIVAVFAALLGFGVAGYAHAGQPCSQRPPTAMAMQRGLALTEQVQTHLQDSGAQVAVIARVGDDVRRHGLRWTHAGIAYQSPGQPWRVLHKLNECGTDRSGLYQQGLGNFFLDAPFEYRSLVAILKPTAAQQVLAAIAAEKAVWVHQPHYSLIAYPFALDYQNSNGWVLEFLTLATHLGDSPRSRAAVQQLLRTHGYRPDRIEIGVLERVGAGLARPNVHFLDHPLSDRLARRYSIVSVESLLRWATRSGLLATEQELSLLSNP
jgi:hypothetical protein